VAKDHHLDVPCQIVGGVSYQLDQSAQQQIREREEHRPNLPGERGPILRTHWVRRCSLVSVPFRVERCDKDGKDEPRSSGCAWPDKEEATSIADTRGRFR
jgi:hypothetical protein